MSGRKTPSGPEENPNPWVRRLPGDEADEDTGTKTEPVVSPWNYPVDPPPGTGPGTGTPEQGGPARPPSLRRTPAEPKRRGTVRKVLIPVLAALVVVAVVAVVLLNVLGGDQPSSNLSTPPSGTPSASVGTPSGGPSTPAPSTPVQSGSPSAPGTSSTYVPPGNALPVAYGVSVVPAPGWTVFTPETEGKELVPGPPNNHSTWFWVRQRQNVNAEDYAIRIFEGETKGGSQIKAGATQKPACPRDVLVECVSISYTMLLPKERSGLSMRCEVQAFRRSDGVVTAMDFCSRPAFYDKAYADATLMLKTVIDSQ